ncbi:pentapeptide repeat-containing protein [Nostoc sp. LEGE 12450]|uniref:pentapeptide repeat-containing protein n=1 Tax=Nostoc sp. LEGE 12450 TaxID=1828643 RepID=UPI0018817B9A|nr:pentapeptide repeat-containing protein [Nostoc sp. LEGE 12450]MBE8991078.1 pentapeptide repeat-containing protein [Nostoc sp. LEGE 12450]
MANEEHLAILRQGVEVWNEWRKNNPEIKPDLCSINFSGADLSEADFSLSDLRNADFTEVNLTDAYFEKANLKFSELRKVTLGKSDILEVAYFEEIDYIPSNIDDDNEIFIEGNFENKILRGINLSTSIITRARFHKANLINTSFYKANLAQAKFNNSNLKEANFLKANLSGIDLSGVDFSEIDFKYIKLIQIALTQTNLSNKDISEAKLFNVNLSNTDLRGANLTRAELLYTNLTRATLTGACIEDWNINSATSLTDVICDYIYRRQGQKERRPSNGNFAPGEFTKLFQKSLETVDLIFRNGIDWDAFVYSFKKLEVENQGAQLDVQSIEKKGDGILVVRVAVAPNADKAKIHSEFIQSYEFAAKALEAQYQARLEDKDTLISKQEAQINRLFDIVEQQGSVQKALAENPKKVSNYDQRYSQFAGGNVDANTVDADQIGGNIQNNDA